MSFKLYKRFFQFLKPYLRRFLEAALCMGCVALLTTAPVWLIRRVMDDVLIAKDLRMLFLLTLVFPLLYLLKGVFSYIQNYLMNYISQAVIRDLRARLYAHLQSLSLDFFYLHPTGKLMSRLTNDTTTLQISIVQVPVQVIRDGLTLIFLIGTIFYLNWRFALITLILLPVAAVPVSILGSKLRRAGRNINVQMGNLFSSLHEGITGQIITKIFLKEEEEVRRFEEENSRYYSEWMRWVRADVLGAPIMEFLGSIAAVFLLWYGGKDVIDGRWTIGSFFTFLGASISAYKPVKDFTSVNARLQQGAACAERIFELLDQKPSVVQAPEARILPAFRNEIVYDNVSFSYDGTHRALDQIALRVRSGEVVALAGPSGAGKSTLTLLLPRLLDPQEGAILIDGADIRQATLDSLRNQIGIVTQDVILFNDTVAYNIAYGRKKEPGAPEPSREAILHAAQVANAHEFISRMPQGYETLIGERGVRLSGGQRQRLSIARAVLKNPPILILDEATSSLDAESEKLVQEAIERLMENRTVLVVAHRLSTIRRADRILVLENGRIVEEGKHEALMDQSGTYRRLYEIQSF